MVEYQKMVIDIDQCDLVRRFLVSHLLYKHQIIFSCPIFYSICTETLPLVPLALSLRISPIIHFYFSKAKIEQYDLICAIVVSIVRQVQ